MITLLWITDLLLINNLYEEFPIPLILVALTVLLALAYDYEILKEKK